ncbi:LuxR family transcriptional regulator [Bradyrhizobium symbiodeficiens]|nr:LuxR family transcriptional regulator [Bradyrhizobium symbiodeficiens]QDF42287.1 LuxR family transcriptional regulator [Bradyrhizobium symbiodeficiens]
MHRLFQQFVERLASASSRESLGDAMSGAAAALHLPCFAYLAVPDRSGNAPQLISNYPLKWTQHYLQNNYERFDPVILEALEQPEPFKWGLGLERISFSTPQREMLAQAASFGIRHGFTVPIHSASGLTAAVTFAVDERRPSFDRCIEEYARVLQLMAICFHSHALRKLHPDHGIGGWSLSPRELECLEWAAQGKSAWEIGRILGISRYTVASYLENAKEKLGVRTIVQAATRLAAARTQQQD